MIKFLKISQILSKSIGFLLKTQFLVQVDRRFPLEIIKKEYAGIAQW
jgi:hypothetical protein